MAGDEDQKLLEQNKSSNSFKTSEPWENSNHSLFLHHSDQPGVVLVSQSLMEDNYTNMSTVNEHGTYYKKQEGLCRWNSQETDS